ncbi:MAG: hypothetical protein HDR00_14280 [Lachnospiraceae bacterium]|nr:hypothetical protein [Lachnospiraceae bacterium]
MEWIANTQMKQLLNRLGDYESTEKLKLNMKHLNDLFCPPFKKVKDCILISKHSVEELEKSFNSAIEVYTDKTGYEFSVSEVRISDYFKNKISMETGTKIALLVIKMWILQLKELDPNATFCLIMSSDEDRVEIRFHKLREEEPKILADDIDSYKDGAIGYVCI